MTARIKERETLKVWGVLYGRAAAENPKTKHNALPPSLDHTASGVGTEGGRYNSARKQEFASEDTMTRFLNEKDLRRGMSQPKRAPPLRVVPRDEKTAPEPRVRL